MPSTPFQLDSLPAKGAFAITPADGTGLQWSGPIRGFYAGGAGNVALTGLDGNDVTLVGVLAGQVYQIAALRVKATGTTALNLVGLI